MATKRKQTDYWKVVKIDKDSNEITMLDYVFNHSKKFKGATGTVFEPVSKEHYKESLKKENVVNYITEAGDFSKRQALEMYQDAKANNALDEIIFDLSYREHWDTLREHGYPKSEYPIFNCIGGGRCFDKNFDGTVNPELTEIIKEYEK